MKLLEGVRAVIFDNNGTIFDDLKTLAYGSVRETFQYFAVTPPSLEVYREEITSNFVDFYRAHGLSGDPSSPKFADAKIINGIRKRYYELNSYAAKFRPDTEKVFAALRARNIILGIVSAEVPSVLNRRLQEANLLKYLSLVKGDCWDKRAALVQASKIFSLDPSNIAYIDDTRDGTEAAKASGMRAIGFGGPTGYNSRKQLLTVTGFVIEELSELLL